MDSLTDALRSVADYADHERANAIRDWCAHRATELDATRRHDIAIAVAAYQDDPLAEMSDDYREEVGARVRAYLRREPAPGPAGAPVQETVAAAAPPRRRPPGDGGIAPVAAPNFDRVAVLLLPPGTPFVAPSGDTETDNADGDSSVPDLNAGRAEREYGRYWLSRWGVLLFTAVPPDAEARAIVFSDVEYGWQAIIWLGLARPIHIKHFETKHEVRDQVTARYDAWVKENKAKA